MIKKTPDYPIGKTRPLIPSGRYLLFTLIFFLMTLVWTALLGWWHKPSEKLYSQTGVAPGQARALLGYSEAQLQAAIQQQASGLKTEDLETRQEDSPHTNPVSHDFNPEWGLMERLFTVGALANFALQHPEQKEEKLKFIDYLVHKTLQEEARYGPDYFLLPYGQGHPLRIRQPAGNQFVDGEIALMLGMRRVVADQANYKKLHRQRLQTIVQRMRQGPILSAESYPDELWLFCNSIALAAIRLGDYLDGTDHKIFFQKWMQQTRKHLLDKNSGLLASSFQLNGTILQGPEGSSLWMSLHCLQLIDPVFAREQYKLARQSLIRNSLGFAWAREWPASMQGQPASRGANLADIDSGLVVPFFEASPASSGLAMVAAAAFQDRSTLSALLASLLLVAYANQNEQELHFAGTGSMGHAVLVYALWQGPLWQKVGAPE